MICQGLPRVERLLRQRELKCTQRDVSWIRRRCGQRTLRDPCSSSGRQSCWTPGGRGILQALGLPSSSWDRCYQDVAWNMHEDHTWTSKLFPVARCRSGVPKTTCHVRQWRRRLRSCCLWPISGATREWSQAPPVFRSWDRTTTRIPGPGHLTLRWSLLLSLRKRLACPYTVPSEPSGHGRS